jgi:hypothetical protein
MKDAGYAEFPAGGDLGSGHVRVGRHVADACKLADARRVRHGSETRTGDTSGHGNPSCDSFNGLSRGDAAPHEPDWKDLCREASIEQDPEKVFELVKRILDLLDKNRV